MWNTSATIGGCASVAAFVLDQVTKALAIANAGTLAGAPGAIPGVDPVFHRNASVSFGMLDDAGCRFGADA
ncbi:hypothetical protein [Roseovarius sp. M141]|uniref:hypothetical protein n=1 Tax=Roseovarius sp. M141 TaxID=2583806 RepID=UPI0020CBC386|nr:hypothetical protein [Roseovarius sp. M141]MCQ0094202.1 hypothetical protein [Roseovarius sp. M141]